jgi:tetratricopeptide (TPR) repeat protein
MKRNIIKILLIFFITLALGSCGRKFTPSQGLLMKTLDSSAFDRIYVEAIRLKLMGNEGEALKYFEQCIKINPLSDAVYYQMAQIVASVGNLNLSKKYLLKSLSIQPGNSWYAVMLSGIYYKERDLDSAIIYYENAARNSPDKDDMSFSLAKLYSENKNFDKSNQILELLDNKLGVNSTSTVYSIRNLMALKKFDKAREKTFLLLKEYPDEMIYNGLLAEIYQGEGNSKLALGVYEKLILKNPEEPQVQLSFCDFLIKNKMFSDLITMLNTVALNTRIPEEDKISLFARIIEIDELLKQDSDRISLALMLLEANYKDNGFIALLRPELLIKLGKSKEAEERLEIIIKNTPDNYYAWERLLFIYLQSGDYVKLQKKGEECATRFNRSFVAKILYANGALQNKNYQIALAELRKASILAGEDKEKMVQVLTLKADVYYRMNDYENSFKTFEEALKLNSGDLTIINNYAYYLAERNLRLKDAEIMAKKVIELESDNISYLDTYAWILYKRGKLKAAAKIMEQIISDGKPNDAELFEHYGFILKGQKDCQKAIANWEIAIKLDSTKSNLKNEIVNCK